MINPLRSSTLVYINLGLGLFVTLANGGALALVLSGHGDGLSQQIPEISLWMLTGAILFLSGVYATFRKDSQLAILRFQTLGILALLLGLLWWGGTIVLGGGMAQGRISWTAGYLSIVSLYAAFLVTRVYQMRIPRKTITDSTVIAISGSTPIRSVDTVVAAREDWRLLGGV
jgi:drug/metabolite transporter (DMT)-like permease